MNYKIKDCTSYSTNFYKKNYRLLNSYQKDKIDRLKNIQDKKLSLLGMALASEMLDIPIGNIEYENHKPKVPDKYLSITHKYPFVGVAVSNKKIGIDLETLRDIDKAALYYLKARDNLEALILWTKKESLFKAAPTKGCHYRTMILDRRFIVTICEEA